MGWDKAVGADSVYGAGATVSPSCMLAGNPENPACMGFSLLQSNFLQTGAWKHRIPGAGILVRIPVEVGGLYGWLSKLGSRSGP